MPVATTPSQELVIAIAGAVGTRLDLVTVELQLALRAYDVDAEEISLNAALRGLPGQPELPETPYDEQVMAYMAAGNKLRKDWNRDDALALLAVEQIRARRRRGRVANILRSVNHPAEVATLRAIYGSRFFLVSAYRPREMRLRAVRELIADTSGSADPTDWTYLPEQILEQDEHQPESFAQKLRDTFPLADYFIDASSRDRMRPEIERFIALLFGDPFRTPTREEYALTCAEAAALRSAELGRQVGACLTSPDGEVISLGTNEVPKAGGGIYWEGEDGDAREFHLGADTNDIRKREIAEEIVIKLAENKMLNDAVLSGAGENVPGPVDVLDTILATRLGALTEFGRAAHAEMAALMDAARRGVSVQGAKLYSTTFPCHNCARHLILAGISEVVYVAPYAKSQAFRLHDDAIVVAAADPPKNKLHLRPFVGAAARLYSQVFAPSKRKERSGEVVPFDPTRAHLVAAEPVPAELRTDEPIYLARETKALAVLAQQRKEINPAPDFPDAPEE